MRANAMQEIPEENHGNSSLNWEEFERIRDLADFDNAY